MKSSTTLRRPLSRPAHQTLTSATVTALRQAIESGTFAPGAQLPPEMELVERLGVSRTTLREALRSLENLALIERRRGLGTYVASTPIVKDLSINFGISEMVRQAGMEPGSLFSEDREEKATGEVAQALQLDEGDPVLTYSRVRSANGRPVVWSIDILPRALLGEGRLVAYHPQKESLYQFLDQKLGIRVTRGTAELRPIVAQQDVATRLQIKRGTPLMLIKQTDYDPANRPVLHSIEYHLPDVFVFLINRKGPY
jgi:GntR family transcriptional regulator